MGHGVSKHQESTQHVCKYSNESYDSIRNIPKVRLDESRMKAADIERRREMWEAHAFEEFISDLISPDRSGHTKTRKYHTFIGFMHLQFDMELAHCIASLFNFFDV